MIQHTPQQLLEAKDRVVRTYRFTTTHMSPEVWELLVLRSLEDVIEEDTLSEYLYN